MRIIFSEHSLLKLKQRNIAKQKVIQTIKKPDVVLPSLSKRILAYKKFGALYLKVVFIEENDTIVIVTQHWDQQFTRKICPVVEL